MELNELLTNIYKTLINNIEKMDKVSMIRSDGNTITISQSNDKTIRIKFEEETSNEM